jgi:oligosaccharyl transferase (archaeosortase A-associated)
MLRCGPVFRRDLILLALIAAAGFGIRTYPAWDAVFGDNGIGFLETDAWYHVRLVENQVRHFPWRVTVDPYAARGGQFVPIAPLFDTMTATAVVLIHGRDAATQQVERIAAFVPPVLGALTMIAVWALAATLFDRRAGLLAAALLAVLPGHFLDRTMLGFVDHHALEALLAVLALLTLTRGAMQPSAFNGVVAGVMLGLYLLCWASGAFLLAIVGAWILLVLPIVRSNNDVAAVASTAGTAALTAFVLVIAFQDVRMHRYGSQVLGLAGVAAIALGAAVASRRTASSARRRMVIAGVAIASVVTGAVVLWVGREVVSQVLIDVARLAPNPTRMGVLEARPLFLYAGEWRWTQPWVFFRTGFFIAVIALVPFGMRILRERRPGDVLLILFVLVTLAATIGQNRFGYYFVVGCAVLGGWLATVILDWGGVAHAGNRTPEPKTRMPLARDLAVIAVAGGMFAPNLAPSLLLAERTSSFPVYWRDAMAWLATHTPVPFAQSGHGDDYYFARYAPSSPAIADYTVMNWWDQGYWITQSARRVPVSNPTQERAPTSGRFYSETDEGRALDLLRDAACRYVLSDWELPFRKLADGTIMGRFQNVVDWASGTHADYYEVLYRRQSGGWTPVWTFREPYYRSMAFRLSVLGGAGAVPANSTAVIIVADRVDGRGLQFREIVSEQTYVTFAAAQRALAAAGSSASIVGLDPWRVAFPVEPLQSLVEVNAVRTVEQKPTEAPWVRIFAVR